MLFMFQEKYFVLTPKRLKLSQQLFSFSMFEQKFSHLILSTAVTFQFAKIYYAKKTATTTVIQNSTICKTQILL
jgi:hypothetical protein